MQDYYLSCLGVRRWKCRGEKNEQLHYYQLTKSNYFVGYLVLRINDDCSSNAELLHFLSFMLKAAALEMHGQGTCLLNEPLPNLANTKIVVAVGDLANNFVNKHLQVVPIKIHCPNLQQIFISPLEKKEIWRKLRNFT